MHVTMVSGDHICFEITNYARETIQPQIVRKDDLAEVFCNSQTLDTRTLHNCEGCLQNSLITKETYIVS